MRTLDALSGCRSPNGRRFVTAKLNSIPAQEIRHRSPPEIGRRPMAQGFRGLPTRRAPRLVP
jgi:hypothetical protein